MVQRLGRYELIRPIGRGGMAEIWLGRQRGAGGIEKRVVIKRILREKISDPRFLDLFVGEAQISMALSHKNIVPTFDFGRVGDELFLVMEYIDGPSWAMALTKVQAKGKLPSAVLVAHIAFEACQALQYAHAYTDHAGQVQRIAHRDVTPGNLLLSFSGDVKLGDFGLAAATADVNHASGSARGTPAYMAPEQARGEFTGPSADIYSLGLILTEALSFKKARNGTVAEQIAAASLELPPLPNSVPSALRDICKRATELGINDRYPSAAAMAEDLDAYLLHARATNRSDRRPMAVRLADWLQDLMPEGLPRGKFDTHKLDGAAVTYLDDGAEQVLGTALDATMRSVAETALDGDTAPEKTPAGETVSETQSGETVAAETPEKGRLGLWLGLAALSAGAYLVFSGDGSHTVSSNAPLPAPIDAHSLDGPRDASPADVRPPDARLPDANIGKVDAALKGLGKRRRDADTGQAKKPTALLQVSSTPWATVQVVGRSEGCEETPCRLQLPAGSYQLRLANPVAGLKKTISVTLKDEETQRLHAVLTP